MKNLSQQQQDIASRISYLVGKLFGGKVDHGWYEVKAYHGGKTITIKSYSDAGVYKIKITTESGNEN